MNAFLSFVMNKKLQKKGDVLNILKLEEIDPESILRDFRNNNQWGNIVSLKKYLEKRARQKLDFTEIPGFKEAFRKKYLALLKQDAVQEAKELLSELGEGIDITEETREALIYCMGKNHVDTFCKILKEKLADKRETNKAIQEGVVRQIRKSMTRLFEFANQCGIPISPDVIQKGAFLGAVDWKENLG